MSNADGTVNKPLNAAVIGLGVGEQHARTYRDLEDCRLSYVYDLDRKQAESIATSLETPDVAESYEQILNDPEVDLVSLASFDDAHYQQVVDALKANKHVFVEKPLCRTFEELEEIHALYQKKTNLHLKSNLVLRGAPLYLWLKQEIEKGTFGEIYAFDGDYLYGRIHKITEGWRKNVDDYSVMEGGGIHLVDLMLKLTGEKPESVETTGNNICTRETEFRYNDFMAARFLFESGLVGRVTANFGCVHRHQHVLRIFGTNATFLYDDQGPRIHRKRNPDHREQHIDQSPFPDHKGVLIPEFVRGIQEGLDPIPQAKREFDLISIVASSDKSLKTSRSINIRYPEIS